MAEYETVEHGFGPVFDERSAVLVLGSFPSVKSRDEGFYYGNPRNRFWRVVCACTGDPVPPDEPRDASVAQKKALLLRAGVALWDVVECCQVRGSSDSSIRDVVPVDVARVWRPGMPVLANGKTAARLYERLLFPTTGVHAQALPSTSPANAAFSLERLLQAWGPALSPHVRHL